MPGFLAHPGKQAPCTSAITSHRPNPGKREHPHTPWKLPEYVSRHSSHQSPARGPHHETRRGLDIPRKTVSSARHITSSTSKPRPASGDTPPSTVINRLRRNRVRKTAATPDRSTCAGWVFCQEALTAAARERISAKRNMSSAAAPGRPAEKFALIRSLSQPESDQAAPASGKPERQKRNSRTNRLNATGPSRRGIENPAERCS